MLACENLRVQAGGRPLLQPLDLGWSPGRVQVVLGPNGAGKSSLLGLLSGLSAPGQGQVTLDGRGLAEWKPAALARQRACVPQDGQVAFDFTAEAVVELGRHAHRLSPMPQQADRVAEVMAALGLSELRGRRFNSLSGGERARVHLARACAQIWEAPPDGGSRWLLLDEPTAALDLAHQHQSLRWLRDWSRAQRVGVVAVLHDLNLALRYADEALVLGRQVPGQALPEGRQGPVRELLTPALVRQVWGVDCQAVGHGGVPQLLFG
ncbi:MAG: ATP-binding cassette domain-containing protein [Curvibacter sp.]|nr:ATP-binding cassette domain-containing protein [Curvibacter sp.]